MANGIKKLFASPWRFRIYLLLKLPLAFIAGLRLNSINSNYVSIGVPYNFITKNPFNSIYFAALAMAAELPSGILAINQVENVGKPMSMLVLSMKGSFLKKAKSRIIFTCNDSEKIRSAIESSIKTGEPHVVDVKSVGIDSSGEPVAEFTFTWTFKAKNY